jgi:hypothetical protein
LICTEHVGRIETHGYGQVYVAGRWKQAHRLAWERARGPIPAGMCVLHRCDNRRCVEVAHLFLGTKADNTADMMFAKGRAPSQKGSKNPAARLSETDIPVIRALVRDGATLKTVAARYGVSFQNVSDIKLGKRWAHVKEIDHLHRR